MVRLLTSGEMHDSVGLATLEAITRLPYHEQTGAGGTIMRLLDEELPTTAAIVTSAERRDQRTAPHAAADATMNDSAADAAADAAMNARSWRSWAQKAAMNGAAADAAAHAAMNDAAADATMHARMNGRTEL